MQSELVKLIEDARRRQILAETATAYETMSDEEWAEIEAERRAWDVTLTDGLDEA